MSDLTVQQAMFVLNEAIKEDPAYAYGWHSNIAMMCSDAFHNADIVDDECLHEIHRVSNDAASRFMKLCFGVETSQDMMLEITRNQPTDIDK